MKETFGDCTITRRAPVAWTPRSCGLTPLNHFLWGYAKSVAYADMSETIDVLEESSRRVIADKRPQLRCGRKLWFSAEIYASQLRWSCPNKHPLKTIDRGEVYITICRE